MKESSLTLYALRGKYELSPEAMKRFLLTAQPDDANCIAVGLIESPISPLSAFSLNPFADIDDCREMFRLELRAHC